MKYQYSILLFIVFALFFSGCDNVKPTYNEIGPEYSRDTLVKIASKNFDNAIHYVIEGEVNGKLTAYQSNYLCAQLTYQFTTNNLMAIKYCQNALLALDLDDNYKDRVEVLYLMSNVAYAELDLNTSIKASLEGKAIAHKHKMLFEEASFDYNVGRCRFNMGENEGLGIMQEAIERASKIVDKRIEFGHLVFFVGDLSLCYATLGHTQPRYMYDLLSELEIQENLVNEMERRYPEAKDYCDRNRFQITLYRAVANAALGNTDVAEKYMEVGLKSSFAYMPSEHSRHLEYYAEMGNLDSVLYLANKYPYEGDTVNRVFRRGLALIEIAYRKAGDINMANEYHKRYLVISELIDQRELKEGLEKNAIKYDTQNYRLALDDTELEQQRLYFILIVVVMVFVIFILLGTFAIKRNTKVIDKNKPAPRK